MVVVSSLISSGKFKMLSKNKYTTSDVLIYFIKRATILISTLYYVDNTRNSI